MTERQDLTRALEEDYELDHSGSDAAGRGRI